MRDGDDAPAATAAKPPRKRRLSALFEKYIYWMRDGDDAPAPVPAPAPTGAKPPLKQRLSALFEEYGQIAIITYFTLSILTIIGFSVAIWIGVKPSSETGVLGVIIAGWGAAKLTLPIRILITLGLTPVVAFVVRRWRGAPDASEPVDAATPSDEPASEPASKPPAPGAS
jgi:hypothetical protein